MIFLFLFLTGAFAHSPQPGCSILFGQEIEHARVSEILLNKFDESSNSIGVWLYFETPIDAVSLVKNYNLTFEEPNHDRHKTFILVRGSPENIVRLLATEADVVYSSFEHGLNEQPFHF